MNEFDFEVKYIAGKENYVADALSRIKIQECNYGEDDSVVATIHSASEDSQNFIGITERPLNIFKRQLKLIRGDKNSFKTENVFKNNLTTVTYTELSTVLIKEIISKYLLNFKVAMYMPNDYDFVIFQNVYKSVFQNKRNSLVRATKLLENIFEYADLKTKILQIHLEGLHQGIEKVANCFKAKYYFPNYLKEITKVINECELCNHCKNDHIAFKIPLKVTPPVYETREKFVVDIWEWDKHHYLTCIDIYSKYAIVEEISSLNWLETKKTLLKVFNVMGPPKVLKIDQDQGINNVNIKQWCEQLNVKLEVTTGKTGIGDIERLHKTLNEKLRIINTSDNQELKYYKIEQTIFTYNHNIVHSTTGETPYNIFFNKLSPKLNQQLIKEKRIQNINSTRKDTAIDTNFVSAENSRKRLDKSKNPFRQVKLVKAEDDNEHFVVKFKNRNVRKYKSQFKRKRKKNL